MGQPPPRQLFLSFFVFPGVVVALCLLAATSSGCEESRRPVLPPPVLFRDQLGRLVFEKRWAEATALLRGTDPSVLARAASERSDIKYAVIGSGRLPGLEGPRRPARTWPFPGTTDPPADRDQQLYQFVAYDFAKQYNQSLAHEERGVR